MSKKNDRTVSPRPDGTWANKRNDASRATSLHRTQAEATSAAKADTRRAGGGEVTVQRTDGQFGRKDTVAPGNDPCPPKDKG